LLGFNARIQYTIISGNTGNMFWIDANTGKVTTNNIPDRETLDRYSLKIRVQDLGRPPRGTDRSYTVVINDKNDNNPVFEKSTYSKTVLENTNVNTEVIKVSDQLVAFCIKL